MIIAVILIISGYFYVHHEINHHLDTRIYTQLEEINLQLDKLDRNADSFSKFKAINGQIADQLSIITPLNYNDYELSLTRLVESTVNFAPQTAAVFESLINTTTDKNYKFKKRQFKLEARELKYGYNQQVQQFNQQISTIGTQLNALEKQVGEIDNADLQSLEQARIKFIRHKLNAVDGKIKANLLLEILDDLDEPESEPVRN